MRSIIFLLVILLLPTIANALGVGVAPDNLEFTEVGEQKSFFIVNPNPFPLDFKVRGPYFRYDAPQGMILQNSRRKIVATLQEPVEALSVILVETSPSSGEKKPVGMLPTVGIRTRISLHNNESEDSPNIGEPLFQSSEIIAIAVLGTAVSVMGLLPYLRRANIRRRIKLKKKSRGFRR
jgi:hypothetical protein